MTVGELQELIKDLPKDMPVGGTGHFGEQLDCFGVSVQEVYKNHPFARKSANDKITILSFSIEDAGEEPS